MKTETKTRKFAVLNRTFTFDYHGWPSTLDAGTSLPVGGRGGHTLLEEGLVVHWKADGSTVLPRDAFDVFVEETVTVKKTSRASA